jgi:hypothetical protein
MSIASAAGRLIVGVVAALLGLWAIMEFRGRR